MAELREIVFPGDIIPGTERMQSRIDNTFVEKDRVYASIIGFHNQNGGITPLEGVWKPKIGEIVIGVINDVRNSMYFVDLNFFIKGMIVGSKPGGGRPRQFQRGGGRDFHHHEGPSLNKGDIVEATIKDIEGKGTIILSYPKVLSGGITMMIKPAKIPRVIGKNNTMINQISELTKSEIVVGMNGIIWMHNGNTALASIALLKVESESHTSGLTERIKKMLTGDIL